MLLFDGSRQNDNFACAVRRQRKSSPGRAHVRQPPKHPAQAPDFDSQARAMRFIGSLRPKCARDQRVPRDVSRPRFAQRTCERKQHRTSCERDHPVLVTHDMTASVYDECSGGQQRFNLLEYEESLLAAPNEARGGRAENQRCAFHLRRQRRDTSVACGARGSSERRAR
jgi:hypothetical protein